MSFEQFNIDRGYLFANFLETKGEAFLIQLANTRSLLDCAKLTYDTLILKGLITPIEQLEETDKRELFEEAKRLSQSHNREHISLVIKALHMIGRVCQLEDREAQMRVKIFVEKYGLSNKSLEPDRKNFF